jgi:hypothetical protein
VELQLVGRGARGRLDPDRSRCAPLNDALPELDAGRERVAIDDAEALEDAVSVLEADVVEARKSRGGCHGTKSI